MSRRESNNLRVNDEGLPECQGRIQRSYHVFLPSGDLFSHRLVQSVHCETLHSGVSLTMTAVRETYWIPKLQSVTKSVIQECWGCKRLHVIIAQIPLPGMLPRQD